mgnify:FL=1
MNKLLLSIFGLFWALQAVAQDLKETPLTSQIQEVTLFLSGAQVFEKALSLIHI